MFMHNLFTLITYVIFATFSRTLSKAQVGKLEHGHINSLITSHLLGSYYKATLSMRAKKIKL